MSQHDRRLHTGLALAFALLLLSACATRPPASDPVARAAYDESNDKLEPLNRAMFGLDQELDAAIFRPIVWVYVRVFPEFVRQRITNMLDDVRAPITLVNDLLQGGHRAGQTFGRIVINTTIGIGGMFDVATTKFHIPEHTNDFGQTLAVWGVGEPSYLYLPVLGPSGIRDGIGEGVDAFGFDPIAWYSYNPHNLQWVQYAELGTLLVDTKANTQKTTDELKKSSIDFYATLRSAYQQYRANEIRQDKPGASQMPPMDEGSGDPFAPDTEKAPPPAAH